MPAGASIGCAATCVAAVCGVHVEPEWGAPDRPPAGSGADFVDRTTGITYDIKAFRSRETIAASRRNPPPPGQRLAGEYDGAESIAAIRDEIAQGNRVVIDPRNLQPNDLADLRQRVADAGVDPELVVWWTPPPP